MPAKNPNTDPFFVTAQPQETQRVVDLALNVWEQPQIQSLVVPSETPQILDSGFQSIDRTDIAVSYIAKAALLYPTITLLTEESLFGVSGDADLILTSKFTFTPQARASGSHDYQSSDVFSTLSIIDNTFEWSGGEDSILPLKPDSWLNNRRRKAINKGREVTGTPLTSFQANALVDLLVKFSLARFVYNQNNEAESGDGA